MPDYAQIFEDERRYLWGLLYRITGSGAEADDLLQDTFERAMTRPPDDVDRPWRPWLARVATNLARDALRRRKRREYTGPWLPEPVPMALVSDTTPETRYSARESATFAFLKALEHLTVNQRCVLVLRDVFDYTTAETADLLELSESNVRVTLHRARGSMERYDTRRPSLDEAAVGEALEALMAALVAADAEATAALLAEDVVFTSDAGGEYVAALRPVRGSDRVTRLMLGLMAKQSGVPQLEPVLLNGLPALVVHTSSDLPNTAETMIVRCDVVDGKIAAVDSIVAPAKLRATSLSTGGSGCVP